MTVVLDAGVDAPELRNASDCYVRNLAALWRHDPRLAMALERVAPEDVPALERARDGNWTVRLAAGAQNMGEPVRHGSEHRLAVSTAENQKSKIENQKSEAGVYLHSKYRPAEEADKWAEQQKCENRYAVVVGGFALGYHVGALYRRLMEDAVIVVAEPNLALLRAALGAVDHSEMLESGRVIFFTTLDRALVVERLEPRCALFLGGTGAHEAAIENVKLLVHEASTRVAGDFHRAFQKLVMDFVAYIRTGLITMRENRIATCRNIANNLGRYGTTPPPDLLGNAFAGMPAVLVAAGPSLAKNMHLLEELVEERGGGKTRNTKHETRKGRGREAGGDHCGADHA